MVETVWRALTSLWDDEDGTTMLEYSLLLALVALTSLVAWHDTGRVVADSAHNSAGELQPPTVSVCVNAGGTLCPTP